MGIEIYFAIGIITLIFFILQSIRYNKERKQKVLKMLQDSWGNRPTREYDYDEFENIKGYFNKTSSNNDDIVDDITWNDLDMDTIFMLINNTNSSVGEEYLYNLLRTPTRDNKTLEERDKLITFFENNFEESIEIGKIYTSLGRTKSGNLYNNILCLLDLDRKSNIPHYLSILALIASIVTLLIIPPIGIVALIVVLGYNIVTYYSAKAGVENYFICFNFIVAMINSAEQISKLKIDELEQYNVEIRKLNKLLNPIRRGVGILATNNMNGSIMEVFADYLRMMTHLDLIKFNSMLAITVEHLDEVKALYKILGKIETMKTIASYRTMCEYYIRPQFSCDRGVEFEDLYHPMISEPVVNSLKEERSVLLTGSNASGKSTFLKTIAINAICAQTIFTCTAQKYNTLYYCVYSSMALKDDLVNNESYYIVEIKSLKRILDKVKLGIPVLCFVDEVLRGTNTIERIAASSQILKLLSTSGAMCFAATHDIELTHILEEFFSNYHFQEEVQDDDVIFNYLLYPGRATSRNAIKLLGIIGYDKDIIQQAQGSADAFLSTGKWEKINEM